jgi:hypothetical protein
MTRREPKIVQTVRELLHVDGLGDFEVEVETWDLAGATYHVYAAGECLTEDDAFEHFPTEDELRELVAPKGVCKFCHENKAIHAYHQDAPVCGDCWDERLRVTA